MICKIKTSKRYQFLFLLVVSSLILFNLTQFIKQYKNEGLVTLDLRTYYLSTNLYWEGKNPYSDSLQIKINETYKKENLININRKAGFPHAVAVYLPQFTWEFFIFKSIHFKFLQWIQFVLNFLSLFFISWMVNKLNSKIKFFQVILSLLAFRGTWYALMNGQPMFLAISLIITACYFNEKNKKIASSIFFALAAFKVTFLLPFFAFFLYQKQFKLITYIAILILLFNVFPIVFYSEPLELINQCLSNMSKLLEFTHVHNLINGLNIISTSITIPLVYFFDISLNTIKVISIVSLLILFLLLKNNGVKSGIVLTLFSLGVFTFSHFLIYDLMFLLIAYFLHFDKENDRFLLLSLLILAFPISKAVELTKIEGLYFYIPYFLFIILLIKTIKVINIRKVRY